MMRLVYGEEEAANLERMPAWANDLFGDLGGQLAAVQDLVELSIMGIRRLQEDARQEQVELLQRLIEHEELGIKPTQHAIAEHDARHERAEYIADVAESESDRGFPMIHAQAVITAWAALEHSIKSFIAGWFIEQPGAQREPLGKIAPTLARLWPSGANHAA